MTDKLLMTSITDKNDQISELSFRINVVLQIINAYLISCLVIANSLSMYLAVIILIHRIKAIVSVLRHPLVAKFNTAVSAAERRAMLIDCQRLHVELIRLIRMAFKFWKYIFICFIILFFQSNEPIPEVSGCCRSVCILELYHHHLLSPFHDAKSRSKKHRVLCRLCGLCLCGFSRLHLWRVLQCWGEEQKHLLLNTLWLFLTRVLLFWLFLLLQMNNIRMALCELEWDSFDIPTRKLIHFMIVCCNREPTIKVGHVFPINMESFSLVRSYSIKT